MSEEPKTPTGCLYNWKSQLPTALACCSGQQQLDAPVGTSGDLATAGSLLPSPAWAETGKRGPGCKTNWLGIAAEPKIIPLHAS